MHSLHARTPIPWKHRSNKLIATWVWETPHFIATVLAEGLGRKMYSWRVHDKSSGVPVDFDSSTGDTFAACVDEVLELIGKSYDAKLGYLAYAGSLATTFEVYDGRAIDFASLIGQTVRVTAYEPTSQVDECYEGILDLHHYEVVVRGPHQTVYVTPRFIREITGEFSRSGLLDALASAPRTSRNKRIFEGEKKRGCTGKVGYRPGTVEHLPSDEFCSIHNM